MEHKDATPEPWVTPGDRGAPPSPPPVPGQGQKWPSYWMPPAAVVAWQAEAPSPGQYPPEPWFPAYQPVPGPYGPTGAVAPPNEPMAAGALIAGVAGLVLNLIGWAFGWLFLGPFFWLAGLVGGITGMVMARVARRHIAEARGALGGDAMVTGGMVTSIISVVLAAGGLVVTLLVVAMFGLLYAAGG